MKIGTVILDLIKFDSIETRLSAIAVIFIMGTAIIMGCMGIWFTHKFVTQRFHDNFIVLSEYLARNAELGVLLKNSEMLQNLTTNMLEQDDIMKVVIKDAARKVIIGTDRKTPLNSHTLLSSQEVSLLSSQEVSLLNSQEVSGSTVKIETKIFQIEPDNGDMEIYDVKTSREIIGYVELYYTPSGLKALTKEMTILFMAISFVLSSVSVAWYWFFARSITSPLIDLVAVSRRVSQGDLEVRASGGNLRETKTLAKVFNEMLNSVKAHQRETEKVHMEMAKQKSLAEIGKFSTMVAHELKNPISIIKGSMDIFKKKNLDETTKETMILYVDEEIERLNRLVDEFLLFAKPKNPILSNISMSAFLCDITEKFKFTVPDKKIKISLNIDDAIVECDGILMERAILNILKNAVEHSIPITRLKKNEIFSEKISTEKILVEQVPVEEVFVDKVPVDKVLIEEVIIEYDAEIEIHGKSKGASYIIEIKDRGKGIDGAIIEEIFNPFFTTRAKGTGLGLAIVRDIVAVHNGTVVVRNRPSGGASFEIKIMAHAVPSFFLK